MSEHAARILIVDDNDLSRLMLVRALDRSFVVIDCRDGMEALQIIESSGPVLLVLDYEMPGLNGAQVCELVRKNTNPVIASLPIILLTAHSGEEHEVECLTAGADDFVSKPVNAAILTARIETHLRLHALRTQLQAQNAELERWRRTHERDLEAAQTTQQAILPARSPEIKGWEVAAHFHPVIQVGGDIYDWLRLPGGEWLIWIADATGHGVSAALVTTLTKLVFRHAAGDRPTAGEILDAVNSEFLGIFKGLSYMTAACLILRPGSGEISYAAAGHPPLLIVRSSGKAEFLRAQAPPIGIPGGAGCDETKTVLEPGDTLLLYTDGLYSLNGEDGERLTPDHLAGFVPASSGSAAEFLEKMVRAVEARAGREPLPDDVAAVALRRV